MLADLFPAFQDELAKIARATAKEKVIAHHNAEKKDWGAFERGLKSKKFRKEVQGHELSDEKLKAYTKNYGDYLDSTKLVSVVPSRTSKKMYTIKELPGGNLGCSCRQWQYRGSVSGEPCAHIKSVNTKKLASAISALSNLTVGAFRASKAQEEAEKVKRNVAKLRAMSGDTQDRSPFEK